MAPDIIDGHAFAPLKIGAFWEYQMDSILYDENGTKIDTTRSYIKEVITENHTNSEAVTIYKIDRFHKPHIDSVYQYKNTWSAYKNTTQFVRTENNLSFIKMTFPIVLNPPKKWKGNVLFDTQNTHIYVAGETLKAYTGWRYKYLAMHESYNVLDKSFANVVEIQNAEVVKDVIQYRIAKEWYAKDIGLIYKEQSILDTQCNTCTEPWTEKASKGFILKQQLLNYGG